eukprot:9457428-Heterocapsa_arctica.AAC.1
MKVYGDTIQFGAEKLASSLRSRTVRRRSCRSTTTTCATRRRMAQRLGERVAAEDRGVTPRCGRIRNGHGVLSAWR